MTLEVNLIKPDVIESDWCQCQSCGWIGPSENAVMGGGYGQLMSCPACTDLALEEYHGPTEVTIDVGLLSDIQSMLIHATFMLGNSKFSDEYKKMHGVSAANIATRVEELQVKNGLLPEEKSDG